MMQVAVAIIMNRQKQILISKRLSHQYAPGLWEFPGGKLEPDESHFQALVREVKEEVNLTVLSAHPFMQVHHDYGDREVSLDVWVIDQFDGEALGMQGQLLRWIAIDELDQYEFPKGNDLIVERLKK